MYKVLIVDDFEILRRDIKRLKLWGQNSGFYVCDEAKDGLEALEKLKTNKFDLIITDIRMPRMDGIELLQCIYEKNLCTYTILLSDYTEYSYARQGLVYGAFDYIGKPINENELSRILIRVKDQLVKKEDEEQKLKELEGIIEKSCINNTIIKEILELILNGDEKASLLTASMIDSIMGSFNHDKIKALIVLKNAMNDIIDETLKNYTWIKMFYTHNLMKVDFFDCTEEWGKIKERSIDRVEKLIRVVHKFMGNFDNSTVTQVCLYVLNHINEDLSVKTLSEKLFINKSYLSYIFKKNFGISLLEYLTMVKLERAKMLIKINTLKNYEIANQLGFKDIEYFSKLFKKYTGSSPTEYRH
jgi:two-component system response regulator YesN